MTSIILIEILTFTICILLNIGFTFFFIYRYQRYEISKSWDKVIFSICFILTILIALINAICVEDSLEIYPIYFVYSFIPFHLHKIGANKNDFHSVLRWLVPILVALPLFGTLLEYFKFHSRDLNIQLSILLILSIFIISEILCLVLFFRRVFNGVHPYGHWANLNLIIDNLYRLLLFSFIVFFVYSLSWKSKYKIVIHSVLLLKITGLYGACIIRKTNSQIYIFWRGQEKRIIEAMKSSLVQVRDEDSLEAIYKEVYQRVLEYVEGEKAFLNGNLSINDVAKYTFSNKVYVSRAISQYTGRNFCQFVNYFRVQYAIEAFKDDPYLKVSQLALMSGFHSSVSFNTSFKLFMRESPSEWCRRTRAKLNKKKK